MERPALFQSKLVASVPAEGGRVMLFTFAYAVGASTSYMSVVTVTDPDQQSSGKSGKFKFDNWCLVDLPEEFERIQFDMPTGSEPLLYRETVMIHSCGLLLCGQNKYVRHWLDVFLRDRVPQRTAVELNYGQDFLLHMHVSQWSRSFKITKDSLFEWVEPPQPSRRPPPPPSAREETMPSSSQLPTETEVPRFEVAPSANMNTDEWLLRMMHPCLREVSQELQVLLQEHSMASEGSDPAQQDAFAVIKGRNLATSLMVDTILEQWETVIPPLDVQSSVADDMETGTNSQEV